MQRQFKFCREFEWRWEDTPTRVHDRCNSCERFFARCCRSSAGDVSACHGHPLVFVDGSCLANGQHNARSGIGFAIGDNALDQVSLSVTNNMDPLDLSRPRTSQRAELLAAIHGLRTLINATLNENGCQPIRCLHMGPDLTSEWVVVADSQYVVKGITEWVPQWKENNWRTSQGELPTNFDLFKCLDDVVTEYERGGFTIRFLHVPRELNTLADRLAKHAADSAVAVFTLGL
ncbi:ribonuclease H-like protein [Favolaschia claudopus]|uniref:ribonuclease H n=1 Tax=Favolaschia claudopus TaxID=2862362 RepID=A0AAW0B7J5_9AGAR